MQDGFQALAARVEESLQAAERQKRKRPMADEQGRLTIKIRTRSGRKTLVSRVPPSSRLAAVKKYCVKRMSASEDTILFSDGVRLRNNMTIQSYLDSGVDLGTIDAL